MIEKTQKELEQYEKQLEKLMRTIIFNSNKMETNDKAYLLGLQDNINNQGE